MLLPKKFSREDEFHGLNKRKISKLTEINNKSKKLSPHGFLDYWVLLSQFTLRHLDDVHPNPMIENAITLKISCNIVSLYEHK